MTCRCYLGSQYVVNARVAEDHKRQRQEISNEHGEIRHCSRRPDAAVHSPRYAHAADDVRRETRQQYLESWQGNPDCGHDRNIHHAFFELQLQTVCLSCVLTAF